MNAAQLSIDSCIVNPPIAANRQVLQGAGAGLLVLFLLILVHHQAFDAHLHRTARECVHGLVVAGMAYAYLRGYCAVQACSDSTRAMPVIVGFGAAFCIVALFIKPFHSEDIFNYINTGWLQAHYGLNPYVHVPGDLPGWQQDPMFYAEWGHTHTVYGFLFTAICKHLCWAGRGDLWTTLLLFKSMNAIVFGLTVHVVWLGCHRLKCLAPERGLYLFLWNPLLLLHVISNGHNDLLMGLLTATSIYLAIRGSWLLVLPVLVAGALVKFGSAALLPFAFLYLVKTHGWRKASLSAGLALVVVAGFAAPWVAAGEHWSDWSRLVTNTTGIHGSLAAFVIFPFEVMARVLPALKPHESAVAAAIKLTLWAGFLGVVARVVWLRLRVDRYDRATFVRDCLLLQFVLICLVSSKYYVWYLGMFFPLALWVSSDDWLHRAALALSCAQLLALTFIGKAHGLNEMLTLFGPLAWAIWPQRKAVASFLTRSVLATMNSHSHHAPRDEASPQLQKA